MLVELVVGGDTDCAELSIEIMMDHHHVHKINCTSKDTTLGILVNEEPGTKLLQIIMNGKSGRHTVLDNQGKIVSDISVHVKKILFDSIDVTDQFCLGQKIYTHDFNGTDLPIQDEFYGIIGCNGTVDIAFDTPISLWFIKHLR